MKLSVTLDDGTTTASTVLAAPKLAINRFTGFGLVNASGAVNLASNWQPVSAELLADSGTIPVNTAIPDNNTTGIIAASNDTIVNDLIYRNSGDAIDIFNDNPVTVTNVTIYTPVVDRALDSRKYIVPGLGDFGDRLYGTN